MDRTTPLGRLLDLIWGDMVILFGIGFFTGQMTSVALRGVEDGDGITFFPFGALALLGLAGCIAIIVRTRRLIRTIKQSTS